MLYTIAHYLRDHTPWIWDMVEKVNSGLFFLRYGNKLKRQHKFSFVPQEFKVVEWRCIPAERMAEFFARQPEEAFLWFKPHDFDAAAIMKLQANKAFMAYVLIDAGNGEIAGYCFNRAFFHGKAFRGRMVGIAYRGKGLGTIMNRILNEEGFGIGLRLFETVNRENVASYRSAMSASEVRIVHENKLNGELYLEIMKDMNMSTKKPIGGGKTLTFRPCYNREAIALVERRVA